MAAAKESYLQAVNNHSIAIVILFIFFFVVKMQIVIIKIKEMVQLAYALFLKIWWKY